MAKFEWSSKYAIGVASMDDEHKVLVRTLDTLAEAIDSGKGEAVVGSALAAVVAYTKTHFAHEEEQLRAAHYPDFLAHKALHTKFIEELEGMTQRAEGPGGSVSLGLVKMLTNWLFSHIMIVDKRYASYLQPK